jgi:hypothetical protein
MSWNQVFRTAAGPMATTASSICRYSCLGRLLDGLDLRQPRAFSGVQSRSMLIFAVVLFRKNKWTI